MKALLMHRDRDFDSAQELPKNASALTQDLELETLLAAMAEGDKFLHDVARRALLCGLAQDRETIEYRQAAVADSLENSETVRALYDLAVEAIETRRKDWLGIHASSPTGVLAGAINLMAMFAQVLRRLRDAAHENADRFKSDAFRTLFATLESELSDAYLGKVQDHLRQLRFPAGVRVSAGLGMGNEGTSYILRKPQDVGWARHLLGRQAPSHSFRVDPRDEAGGRALGQLRDRGINLAANALAQATDHILAFFEMLRTELAFYVGCINLRDRLAGKGEPVCFPKVAPLSERQHRSVELYDVCLSLHMEERVVGNAVDADGRDLILITGANQGGKSCFLRAIGVAQLMAQCGMFVGAESLETSLCTGLFTHYKREEDSTMKSGKLDEELARMSEIAETIAPDAMILFNEAFSATNEREGSEIALQIVSALVEKRIRVFFVTHLYEFAQTLYEKDGEGAAFLRAERLSDGTRTFHLVPGGPLDTSYGQDLYRRLFSVAMTEGG